MSSERPHFRRGILAVLIVYTSRLAVAQAGAAPWTPDIPRAWDDVAVASMEIPLAYAPGSPVYGKPRTASHAESRHDRYELLR